MTATPVGASTSAESDDAALLRRYVRQRDDDAMGELFRRHADTAYRVARRYFANSADAEDAVQTAFARLLRLAGHYPGEGSVKGWIMGFVVSACRTKTRETQRRTAREETALRNRAGVPGAEDLYSDTRERLHQALSQLPEHERMPVWLHYYEGLNSREVGDALKISENTVRSQLARGLERLRTTLAGSGCALSVAELASAIARVPVETAPLAWKTSLLQLAVHQTAGAAAAGGYAATAGKAGILTKLGICVALTAGAGGALKLIVSSAPGTPATGAPQAAMTTFAQLPANTWVPLNPYSVQQPSAPAESGECTLLGHKLIYDATGKRILFYGRWNDQKHGANLQYSNCLFSYDAVSRTITPLRIDNWKTVEKDGKVTSVPMPENALEPTPCPRDAYEGFTYAPSLKAVFLCNGVNNVAVVDGKFVNAAASTWRLDLATNKWSRVNSTAHPFNSPSASMTYCDDSRSIICAVYTGAGQQLWRLDVDSGQWRLVKSGTIDDFGQYVVYDAPRKRVLIAGGGYVGPDKAGNNRRLHALDLKTETLTRLADAPVPLLSMALAHDTRHDRYLIALGPNTAGAPAGTFCYDPRRNDWREVKTANPVPLSTAPAAYFMRLCYDSINDCFIGLAEKDQWYALRYVPSSAE